ncbi:hypothetical protein CAEBREN_11854 [Caenorhabditis brenneri]|uniref:Uncharacterized protein n=1 Tax=Caenorhabditis brenneri TaxID=135651 RepID=G0P042_CAEBE|nr:hypothetical protein CAEBREN_11854 [Caenorhabditis brenneri]
MLRKSSRHRLAENIMAHLKTWGVLVKTLHIPEENLKYFVDSMDFYPFLPYSLNKKKRWDKDFLEEIAEIQNFYEDEVVLFLERTRTGPYDWMRHLDVVLSEQFRIRAVHRLMDSENDPSEIPRKIYEKQKINSIYGQDFRNFNAAKATENRGIVAYNFLGSPRNHMAIFKKKCISQKDNDWPYTTGWLRIRRRKSLKKDLIFFHRNSEDDEFESNETEEVTEKNDRDCRSKCYNLEDHIVERRVRRKRG